MAKPNPMAEQCSATSKATGQRCQIRVLGGGPCRVHGGAAPQVRAAREARLIAAQALNEAPRSLRDAADILVATMQDGDTILQHLKSRLAAGVATGSDFTAIGDWIDRTSRLAKTVHDAKLDERRVHIAEDQGRILAGVIQRVLDLLELDARQLALVPVVVPSELRALNS